MTQTTEIKIKRPLAIHLLALAQQAADQEVCGLIGAIDQQPSTVYPIRNIAKDKHKAFLLDPQEHIQAVKSMRAQDEQLFAIYHSHPNSPAEPSLQDINNFLSSTASDYAELNYRQAYYLIISLNIKGVLEMRAYQLLEQTLQEVVLTV